MSSNAGSSQPPSNHRRWKSTVLNPIDTIHANSARDGLTDMEQVPVHQASRPGQQVHLAGDIDFVTGASSEEQDAEKGSGRGHRRQQSSADFKAVMQDIFGSGSSVTTDISDDIGAHTIKVTFENSEFPEYRYACDLHSVEKIIKPLLPAQSSWQQMSAVAESPGQDGFTREKPFVSHLANRPTGSDTGSVLYGARVSLLPSESATVDLQQIKADLNKELLASEPSDAPAPGSILGLARLREMLEERNLPWLSPISIQVAMTPEEYGTFLGECSAAAEAYSAGDQAQPDS